MKLMRRARVTEMKSQVEGLQIRVEWEEFREKQLYFVIGDKISDTWKFFDRSTWDQCYQPMEDGEELSAKAELVIRESNFSPVFLNVLGDQCAEIVAASTSCGKSAGAN